MKNKNVPNNNNDDISVHFGVAALWGFTIAIFCFLAALKFYRIFDPAGTIWYIALFGFVIGAAYGYWHSAVGHKNK